MKALKKTLLVIGALVAIFCIYAIATDDPKRDEHDAVKRVYDSMCRQRFIETGQKCDPYPEYYGAPADTRTKFSRADRK